MKSIRIQQCLFPQAVCTSFERRNHYCQHLIQGYFSDAKMLTVIILGAAIAWKHAAWLNIQNCCPWAYNSQKFQKQSLGKAITYKHLWLWATLFENDSFLSMAIIIDLTFTYIAAKHVRKDINNLFKFMLDAMQLSFIFDNDVQVVEVCAKKRNGWWRLDQDQYLS